MERVRRERACGSGSGSGSGGGSDVEIDFTRIFAKSHDNVGESV